MGKNAFNILWGQILIYLNVANNARKFVKKI